MTRAPTEMEMVVSAAIDLRIERWFKDKSEPTFNTLDLARAAIRAMHTPTTEMLRGEDIAYIWETMIDAASPGDE